MKQSAKYTCVRLLIGLAALTLTIISASITSEAATAATASDANQQVDEYTGQQQAGNSAPPEVVESYTAYEWTEKFRCNEQQLTNGTISSNRQQQFDWSPAGIWWRIMATRCNRDAYSWRFKYVDELRMQGEIVIKDATIDERLANLLHTLNIHNMFDTRYSYFNSGDAKRDARNELEVAGPEVNDTKCARDLAHMLKLFDELQDRLAQRRAPISSNSTLEPRHIQLARVLDSFGRYESGMLEGKLRLVGDSDECEGSQILIDDNENESNKMSMKMRYCWVNLNINRDLHPLLRDRKRFEHETGDANLNMGVCLPRSCHSRNFHQHARKQLVQKLVDSQLRLPPSIYVHQSYELDSVFCLVDQDSEYGKLPLSGKLCLLVTSCWVLLCIALTLLNKQAQEEQKEKKETRERANFAQRLMQHLDLSQSWHDFISDKRQVNGQETPVDLDTLNPIKLFACTFCVVTHTAFMLGAVASGAGRIAAFVDLNKTLQVALLTSTIIDTFFVISGMLITFVTLKKLHGMAQRKLARFHAARNSISDHDNDNDDDDNSQSLNFSYLRRSSTEPLEGDKSGDGGNCVECNGKAGAESRGRGGGTGDSAGFWSFMGQWFVLALNRYLRIVPLYALLFWFRRDVLIYLGSGPLWDYGLNKETPNGACAQEAWWVPFTFMSAFIPLSKQCYIPSWSISNDIFFGLLIPPILIAYTKRPRLAVASTISLTLIFIMVTIRAHLAAPAGLIWELLEERLHGIVLFFTGLSNLYTSPLFRFPSFLIGALAGFALLKYEARARKRQDDTTSNTSASSSSSAAAAAANWPRWFTGFATQMCWLYLAAHLIIGAFSNELRALAGPYIRPVSFYWLVFDRSVWSAANAIIFLRMVTDWRSNSTIMKAFASQKCRTLAKLNFPIIFIHWLVVVTFLGFLPTPASFTVWQIFAAFSAVAFVSIPAATVVHVCFENPIDKLIKKEIFRF